MADYLVTWEIDIEADSPEEAAEIARNIQLDLDNSATFFEVLDKDSGVKSTVELDENNA